MLLMGTLMSSFEIGEMTHTYTHTHTRTHTHTHIHIDFELLEMQQEGCIEAVHEDVLYDDEE